MRDALIIDSFAGGGGASTGIELALGRSPDVAINHSPEALAMHAANHPDTLHLDSDIWQADPAEVARGRRVGLLWASPDCKHFSKAKGGAPRDRNIRDLAWVIVDWAEKVRPDVIIMENVEEFRTWGPLGEDGQPVRGLAGVTFELWVKRLKRAGYRLQWRELRACDYGAPTIRKRFFMVARSDGGRIVWPKPTHGAPDSPEVRKGRLLPWRTAAECIDWSLPCPSIFAPAAEIMARHGLRAVRPLAANTLARIARGMKRYVIEAEKPFIVNVSNRSEAYAAHQADADAEENGAGRPKHAESTLQGFDLECVRRHGTSGRPRFPGEARRGRAGWSAQNLVAPVLTFAQQGGAVPLGLLAPSLVSAAHGYSGGRREYPLTDPLGTVTVSGVQHALIAPGLVHIGNGERRGQAPRALDPLAPLGTVVASGPRQYPFAAFLCQQNGGQRMGAHAGHDPREPLSTVTASGSHQTPVAAFFTKYYGTGDGSTHADPLHTVTVQDRFGHTEARLSAPPFAPEHEYPAYRAARFLEAWGAWDDRRFVTLEIGGETFVVVDIGMRMLTPRELFNAQGFPPDYVIEGTWAEAAGGWTWHPFSKNVQISCCGNSVCPDLARALAEANCAHLAAKEAVAWWPTHSARSAGTA